ncbi:hypothetical protein XENOCAPTIV_018312 [Xenoophorus captivus]|uniref:Uncharacterized protein n=1 Tax=Xenoophorus captivus TaxID=1517983 RepID=A0ABV0QAP0_9TELE
MTSFRVTSVRSDGTRATDPTLGPKRPPPTHSLLLWSSRWRCRRKTLLSNHQLAVGLSQGPFQLIDAGLVLQQDILRFIKKLEKNHETEAGVSSQSGWPCFKQQNSHLHEQAGRQCWVHWNAIYSAYNTALG